MDATVTQATLTIIHSQTYEMLSTSVGLVAILLLVVFLIEKEIGRAWAGTRRRVWLQTLDIAIVPLLLACGVIIVLRFLDLFNK